MACRHPRGTNGRPPPATRPPPRPPPHSTSHRRSPPRIAAVPHAVPLAVDQASASVLALRDRPVAASLLPSQLLVVEALRRPVESGLRPAIAVVNEGIPVRTRVHGLRQRIQGPGPPQRRVDPPADDPSGEDVDDERDVDEPSPR